MDSSNYLDGGLSSIREAAENYARAFVKLTSHAITDVRTFLQYFQLLLLNREYNYENADIKNENLLVPIEQKGILEVLRIYQMEEATIEEVPFAIDLPTIILYTTLMESQLYRHAFSKINQKEMLTPLGFIYRTVKNICPYQVFSAHIEFEIEHSLRVNGFLMNCGDKLAREMVLNKIKRNLNNPF